MSKSNTQTAKTEVIVCDVIKRLVGKRGSSTVGITYLAATTSLTWSSITLVCVLVLLCCFLLRVPSIYFEKLMIKDICHRMVGKQTRNARAPK